MTPHKLVREDEILPHTQAENAADLVLRPFQQFARWQISGGLALLVCVAIALIWANSPWASAYEKMLHEPFSIPFGEHLRLDLRHWVNSGLMAVFFFVVGLEVKREFLVGELAEPRQAMLPIMAAIGGMVVPALIYVAFNAGGAGANGWGIPMATDIAFALAALAVLGSRIPDGLKIFLVALAIVDDLGALLIVAIFYTASIDWNGIALATAFLVALFVANRTGARRALIYLVLGAGLWYALLISGLHATLAGVLSALFVPAGVRIVPEAMPQVIRRGADAVEAQVADGTGLAMDPGSFRAISALSRVLDAANSPLQRIEHMVQPWVTFGILPLFGLFNAGVAIDGSALRSLANEVNLGIIAGLVIGKPLGICLASWLAVRVGLASLPDAVSWRHVFGTAFLAGIGFTMALFISGLAFSGTELESEAKLGILFASALAAAIGMAILLTLRGSARRSPIGDSAS